MTRRTHHSRWWHVGAAVVTVGLAGSCSVYQPLDQGSRVPWAAAQDGAGAAATSVSGESVVAWSGESYRVRRGDRLGELAESYGVSVAALAQVNGLQPPYVIRVGQELRVPAHAPGAGPKETVVAMRQGGSQAVASVDPARNAKRPAAGHVASKTGAGAATQRVAALNVAPIPAPAEGAAAAPQLKPAKPAAGTAMVAGERHTVRSGETLSGIAQRFDVGLTELAKANDIKSPYRLYAGQKLRIPGGGAYRTTVVDLGKEEPRTVRLATGKPPPLSGNDFLWPVNGKVIGKYGVIDQWRRRDGIDIAARRGAPVLAAQDGIVAYAGNGIRGYGEMILLRHDQGYITTYAHNASLMVEVGEVVRRGQVIARVGDSGDATQSMLHFELRKGRQPINPETRLVHDDQTLASTE